MPTRSRQRGELESSVMDRLWSTDRALTAREIQEGFDEPVPAITTLLTVLDRLVSKGWVSRGTAATGGARGIAFAPTLSRENQIAAAMATALDSTTDRSAALLQFAGELSDTDRALLRGVIGGSERR